nr:c-type cytochrome [Methylorubrum populi]
MQGVKVRRRSRVNVQRCLTGPSLDGVAERWDAAHLRMIVVNPKHVFTEATVMPAFYRIEGLHRVRPEFQGKPILTAQQVEDVVAYLTTLK